MKSVLILNGSPHRDGNGMWMAGRLLDDLAAREAKIIHLHDSGFLPCKGCSVCGGLDNCVLNADGAACAMRDALASDCLVFVSPVHFSSLSAPLVAFISRLQMIWDMPPEARGNRERQCGVLLVSGGSEYPGMFEPSRKVSAAAFKTMNREFLGMVCAAKTDDVPVAENRDVRDAIRLLAERIGM